LNTRLLQRQNPPSLACVQKNSSYVGFYLENMYLPTY
jgi:hypothetical protein